ncbi:MAG: hypothetical protein Q9159_000060 [Coniocarpon cinnabarinum]
MTEIIAQLGRDGLRSALSTANERKIKRSETMPMLEPIRTQRNQVNDSPGAMRIIKPVRVHRNQVHDLPDLAQELPFLPNVEKAPVPEQQLPFLSRSDRFPVLRQGRRPTNLPRSQRTSEAKTSTSAVVSEFNDIHRTPLVYSHDGISGDDMQLKEENEAWTTTNLQPSGIISLISEDLQHFYWDLPTRFQGQTFSSSCLQKVESISMFALKLRGLLASLPCRKAAQVRLAWSSDSAQALRGLQEIVPQPVYMIFFKTFRRILLDCFDTLKNLFQDMKICQLWNGQVISVTPDYEDLGFVAEQKEHIDVFSLHILGTELQCKASVEEDNTHGQLSLQLVISLIDDGYSEKVIKPLYCIVSTHEEWAPQTHPSWHLRLPSAWGNTLYLSEPFQRLAIMKMQVSRSTHGAFHFIPRIFLADLLTDQQDVFEAEVTKFTKSCLHRRIEGPVSQEHNSVLREFCDHALKLGSDGPLWRHRLSHFVIDILCHINDVHVYSLFPVEEGPSYNDNLLELHCEEGHHPIPYACSLCVGVNESDQFVRPDGFASDTFWVADKEWHKYEHVLRDADIACVPLYLAASMDRFVWIARGGSSLAIWTHQVARLELIKDYTASVGATRDGLAELVSGMFLTKKVHCVL